MSDTPSSSSPNPPHRDYPTALQPPVTLGSPNDPIPLYSGLIDFTQNGKPFQAEAHIFLEWLPSPRIRFEIPAVPDEVYPRLGDLSLRLNDGTSIEHAFISGSNQSNGLDGYKASLTGIITQRVIRPKDHAASYALFLLPNFEAPSGQAVARPRNGWRAARLVLAAGGWKITLDNVENDKAVKESLDAGSGFAITQIGRLERDDGKPFTAGDAIIILDTLGWYVSFTCGRWTGPFLARGYDTDSKLIWEIWDTHRTVPYRNWFSWMDTCHREHFEDPFPGFLKLWHDDTWKEVVRVAIHWYIEANAQAGSIEGAIVLTQTAFELLSSAVLVENHGWLSTDGYEKLAAADRIRLLFLWAGIPTAIPPELDNLIKVAKADNWPDAPTAMTMIRNTITHPTRKNREKFSKHTTAARIDAWSLGLRSLELCLLRLFGYRGTYGSRLKQRYSGEVVQVPWAIDQSSTRTTSSST